MERMNNSAERIALPNFDGEQLTDLIKKLVTLEKKWIPTDKGYSLYIRESARATPRAAESVDEYGGGERAPRSLGHPPHALSTPDSRLRAPGFHTPSPKLVAGR